MLQAEGPQIGSKHPSLRFNAVSGDIANLVKNRRSTVNLPYASWGGPRRVCWDARSCAWQALRFRIATADQLRAGTLNYLTAFSWRRLSPALLDSKGLGVLSHRILLPLVIARRISIRSSPVQTRAGRPDGRGRRSASGPWRPSRSGPPQLAEGQEHLLQRDSVEADGLEAALLDLLAVPAMLNIRSGQVRHEESLQSRTARVMSLGRPWPSSTISPMWPPPASAGTRSQCEQPGALRPVAEAASVEPERERQPALPVRVRRPRPTESGIAGDPAPEDEPLPGFGNGPSPVRPMKMQTSALQSKPPSP
jgi:hypothetical protein